MASTAFSNGMRAPVLAARGVSGVHVPAETYDLAGYRVTVAAPPGPALEAVQTLFGGFGPVAHDGLHEALPKYGLARTMGGWQAFAAGEVVHSDSNLAAAASMLEFRVVTDALIQRADLFRMHAASLCLPMKRIGVVLAGDSGQGKTTLTLALMLRGFVPFSDDVALIEPESLELRPFRRPFHVSPQTWQVLEPVAGRPMSIVETVPAGHYSPPQWAERPAPVQLVLFPEYRPQQESRLVALSPADAAVAILAHAASLTHAPQLALATMSRLIAHAKCFQFIVGDLARSVALLERLTA